MVFTFSGGWPARSAENAPADFVHDLSQRSPHGHFDQAGVVDLSHQREDLRALAAFGPDAGVPFPAVADNHGHIGIGFNVIEVARTIPEALFHGMDVFSPGFADFALEGSHERCFLTADKGACPDLEGYVE